MREALAVGGVACVLLAVIAWESLQIEQHAERSERSILAIEKRTEKLETAARVLNEASECQSRCPALKFGGPVDGRYREADNSERDKCNAECEGGMKEKLRNVLEKKPARSFD